MIVLGINAYHGDAAAAILGNGRLLAAAEEERFSRVKHAAGFPAEAIRACLRMAGVDAKDVECFAVSRRPNAHLVRKALFALRRRPRPALVRQRVRNRTAVGGLAEALAWDLGLDVSHVRRRLHSVEHHPSHLASAFFVSPFDTAAVCAIDGFGDFVSTSLAVGEGSRLTLRERVFFPHSLGLLYLAITQYLGFWKYGDEYKVMGLAPYGEPAYVPALRQLLRFRTETAFELDLSYFRHWSEGIAMAWEGGEPVIGQTYTDKLEALLGPARKPDEALDRRHEAIAASLQVVFEEAALRVLNGLYERTRIPRLCLAGGCAMNSVLNGKIRLNTPFTDVYVQPAAADNGTALGSAAYVWHQRLHHERSFVMDHAYWGPEFGDRTIDAEVLTHSAALRRLNAIVRRIDDEDELCRAIAARLAEGRIVGWFQGRMEWGARALGNRSILADPRRSDMRDIINTKIKFREKFRPFAPSILEEAVEEYFVGGSIDPFMVEVYPVRPEKRDLIPAVTHVDGTGRLQAVSRKANPLYWRLIREFQAMTGVPVLLNTSFNENEPIVHTPAEALDCFLRTRIDVLVLGRTVIERPLPD